MFKTLQKQIQKQFEKLLGEGVLYRVKSDRDAIWAAYLEAFPEEARQEHNCNCCKSFIRQFGSIVSIKNGKISTLWDIEPQEEYKAAIKALKDYVAKLAIEKVFYSEDTKAGVEKSIDSKRNVVWNHFYLEIPHVFVKRDSGSIVSGFTDDKNVLKRSLTEITDDAVDTVLELIGQNSIYRGNEFKNLVESFKKVKEEYKKVKAPQKDAFCWEKSRQIGSAASRIKNTSIGTLLNDLSEGKDLDNAVRAYENVVAPSNYKRPTSLVTPKMIEAAKTRLEELGLIGALQRRQLSSNDLNVNNSLFVYRDTYSELDVFDQIKKDTTINPKTLSKVEEISIEDFIKNVLPTAKSVQALVENSHLPNLVSLIGPKDPDEKGGLFKYGNNVSFSYTGQVADSMKTRVVELGGRVDGVLRFTHSWNHPEVGRNGSLMDLHVFLPGSSEHKDGCHDQYPSGQRVGWNNRRDSVSGGVQDVDYTSIAPEGHVPIENITFPDMKKLKNGKYVFKVHNWNLRQPTKSGFRAEIEFGGQLFTYNHPSPLKQKEWVTLAEVTLQNGTFTIEHKLESKTFSQKKWNIDTEKWHSVKAVTLSPNYWQEEPAGNKHYFFFLDNCKTDESVRAFYNEFLKEDLLKDRKVFEILGSKIKVEPVENELSGIGFSDTARNSLFVKVNSKFERILKIKF